LQKGAGKTVATLAVRKSLEGTRTDFWMKGRSSASVNSGFRGAGPDQQAIKEAHTGKLKQGVHFEKRKKGGPASRNSGSKRKRGKIKRQKASGGGNKGRRKTEAKS